MSSEQNAPEVQMQQGPPSPTAQMDDQPDQYGQPDQYSQPRMDQNGQPQDSAHNVQHGMGQSKSSRRRRRKRKNKSPDALQQGRQNGPGQFVGDIQAGEQVLASGGQPQQNFQAGAAQQQAGAGPSTKRWKKKFRDRDRQRSQDNLGNQASPGNGNGAGYRDGNTHQPGNGGSFKRKGKQQRGPRSFVGPMDHSYRAVNGNFADAPASTIDTQGNYMPRGGGSRYVSDSQPIDYSIGRPIPIPEDAPTRIFFFIEDLFFNAKITETARKLGVKVAFIKNDPDVLAGITDGEEADRPGLIVFDLNNANAKPLTLIPKLKAKLKKSTSIVGFLSHLQNELRLKAIEAGCDTVMPRSAFSQNLPNLLRRYGLQEDEEDNFNQ
ncbi:MAG: response regulator [Acidobacteriaceae bacterium]|jgi:hypothetical protein